MKKFTKQLAFGILFILTAFFHNTINAESIPASTGQASGVQCDNSAGVYNTVTSTQLTLGPNSSVLVTATIDAEVTSGNSDITCYFRLNDGSTTSPEIRRFVATKTYTDHQQFRLKYNEHKINEMGFVF